MDQHPILGNRVQYDRGSVGKVYTRTVVLWAYGITMNPFVPFRGATETVRNRNCFGRMWRFVMVEMGQDASVWWLRLVTVPSSPRRKT